MSISYIIHTYIDIYIPCGMCILEFMGITEIQGMKRWQKKEKMLFALKQSCLFYCGLKKRERDYTLTNGLYNPFER